MARTSTLTVAIDAPFERAWTFISDPANLHLWTVDFALERPERAGDVYHVRTPRGVVDVFVKTDRAGGRIDFHFGRDGRYQVSSSRLVQRPDGEGVTYSFTQGEPAEAPPDLFERLVENVRRELQLLKALLEEEDEPGGVPGQGAS